VGKRPLTALVISIVLFGASVLGAYLIRTDAISSNCEAINETRAPLVVILERSRRLNARQGGLDARQRDFYHDSIRSLQPLDCG
jgi:hypothetical protein